MKIILMKIILMKLILIKIILMEITEKIIQGEEREGGVLTAH